MLHLMSGQVGRRTGEWVGEQAGRLGPGMGRHMSVGSWANMGRWASGLASERGQVSEWVGKRAGEQVWEGEQVWAGEWAGEQVGGLGPGTGRWAGIGRWASVGRWASGPASEHGQVSEWVGR